MKEPSSFENDFVELLKTMCKSQGMDDLLATIFALCYIQPEPIAMDGIAQRTGYSLASVCTKVKTLEGVGILSRSSHPGTRRVFLYMEKDMKGLFKRLLAKKVAVLSMLKEKMPGVLSPDKVKTEKDKRKVKIVEDYFNQAMKFLKMYQEMIRKIDAK